MQSVRLPVWQHAWPAHASVTISSTWPLQLLSRPSHTSALGPMLPWHAFTPFTHANTVALPPATHWYTPVLQWVPAMELMPSSRLPVGQQAVFPHASVTLLSMTPLQSSSMPLHSSDCGPTAPEQAPNIDAPGHGLPFEIG